VYPLLFLMTGKQKHIFTEKRKALASKVLARKIGYLKSVDFSLPDLPAQAFNAHRIIRPIDQLFVIQEGVVEIWHSPHDMFITSLEAGRIFGDMPLLGQTMLGTQAIASGSVTLGVMNLALVEEWVKTNSLEILKMIGARFAAVEVEHYRSTFQTVDSRLAGLLLELAGDESSVTGFTQEQLADQLATYRETVTNALDSLKQDGTIEIGRLRITILNKRALKELSEL
jgi:CRP-like cAMP-binding protein